MTVSHSINRRYEKCYTILLCFVMFWGNIPGPFALNLEGESE